MELRFKSANEKIRHLPLDAKDLERNAPRWKLYGLSKQVTEGDCKVDCPPPENAILTSKWQAWQAMRGKTREQALSEFLTEFDRYEASQAAGSTSSASRNTREAQPRPSLLPSGSMNSSMSQPAASPTIATPAAIPIQSKRASLSLPNTPVTGILKEGLLYKQRDVFKGWRPRRFVLQEGFLHYYLEPDDAVPRRSMDICGCKVTAEKPGKFGENDLELFPFVISHIKAAKVYTLACDSKEEADDWIAKISLAAQAAETDVSSRTGTESTILDTAGASGDASAKYRPVHPEVTLGNLPAKYSAKLERAVAALVEAVEPTAPLWEPLYEKNGVIAKKRSGDVLCVRGDGLVPHTVPDVLGMIVNAEKLTDVDSQLQSARLLKVFSQNTGVHHLKYKQVWPTQPRDVVCLYHWRMLSDSRVVLLSFSEKFEELCPVEDGVVRAELILGGYVLTPSSSGETLIQYVVQIDMKGNLASGIVNLVSNSQPLNIFNIKKKLGEEFSTTKSRFAGRAFTFDDLLAVSDVNGDGIGSAANAVASSAASAAATISPSVRAGTQTAAAPAPAEPVEPAAPKPSFIQNAVSSAKNVFAKKATGRGRPPKLSSIALLVLLIPSLVHYIVGESKYRGMIFMLAVVFSIRYVLLMHLGPPERKSSHRGVGPAPSGRTLIRFPADLGKLLRYIHTKGEETGVELTMTHVAIKAAARTIRDLPFMNGRILFGKFYRNLEPGVDISVSVDLPDVGSVMVKVADVDRKPPEYLADELQKTCKSLTDAKKSGTLSKREQFLRRLSPFIASELESWINFLGSQLGFTIPALDIVGFPMGVCTVLTAPKGNEADVDIALVPHSNESSAPVTITIGGIRVLPSLDAERKVTASPVLNVAVSIDTKAASLVDAHRFTSMLQHYMNNPSFIGMDRAEQRKQQAQQAAAKKLMGHGH